MNAGNLNIGPAAQFGQQDLLRAGRARLRQRAPLDDALKRLAGSVLDAKAQNLEKDAGAKKLAAKMDAYVSSLGAGANRALEDMDDEELMIYQHIFTQVTRITQHYEDMLLDFRDQLSAFDRTIRDYQDMLDGKREMAEGLTHEKAAELLDRMKSARKQFLRDTEDSFENGSMGGSGISAIFPRLSKAAGPGGESAAGDYANLDKSFWHIDFKSDDLYGEIDRVLEGVRGVGRRFGETLNAITGELGKRGYTEDKYRRYFDNLREHFMVGWHRQDDPAALMIRYMEDAPEKAGQA